MQFVQQAPRFSAARRSLMLPHRDGETSAIVNALQACALGMRNLRSGDLDDHAVRWLQQLWVLMAVADNAAAATMPAAHWQARAAELDVDQQADLSRLIDELAHWFERQPK